MALSCQLLIADGISPQEVEALLREHGEEVDGAFELGHTLVEVWPADAEDLQAHQDDWSFPGEMDVTFYLDRDDLGRSHQDIGRFIGALASRTPADLLLLFEYDVVLLRRTDGEFEFTSDWEDLYEALKQPA